MCVYRNSSITIFPLKSSVNLCNDIGIDYNLRYDHWVDIDYHNTNAVRYKTKTWWLPYRLRMPPKLLVILTPKNTEVYLLYIFLNYIFIFHLFYSFLKFLYYMLISNWSWSGSLFLPFLKHNGMQLPNYKDNWR